jgi:uncharacterized membrane protein YjjP (DUF1212 family)
MLRRETLVLTLAKLMAAYGIPAYRLEEAAASCARHLGLDAQFFATPTAVFASIGEPGNQRTHLVRLEPGEVNLEKQSQVDAVLRDLLADAVGVDAALGRLDKVVAEPSHYGPGLMVAAQATASVTAAVFFGGGWREVLAAGIVGFIVGVICVLAGLDRRMARLMDFGAGFAAAFFAAALAATMHPISASLVALAGVIVLVPGLTLTTAVAELATRNLASGTARLMGALTIFVSIGFGVAIGQKSGAFVFGQASAPPDPLPGWAEIVALVLAPVALAVLFRAGLRDLKVILPAGVIGFVGARAGAAWLGPELGVCVGAFAVTLASNIWARLADRPTAVPGVPGIMLLVPGSLGFRSVTSFVDADTIGGVQAASSMVLVAVGLAVGLLLANAAVAPRRPL